MVSEKDVRIENAVLCYTVTTMFKGRKSVERCSSVVLRGRRDADVVKLVILDAETCF